jgi:hypothetical protein
MSGLAAERRIFFYPICQKKLKFVGKDGKILIYGLLAKLLNMAMVN